MVDSLGGGYNMSKDKKITCRDCDVAFALTAQEQDIFAKREFDSEPVRCPDCRKVFRKRLP